MIRFSIVCLFFVATTTNTTTATKTPMDFKVYDVDTNNSCKYYERFSDGEEFVYYPTTDTQIGQTLYQAYDPKTCLPVHKALGYSFGAKRMIMSTETGSNTILGMVNKWTGCARFVKRPVTGATTPTVSVARHSTLTNFSSSFCPTIPEVQVDASNDCSYVVDEPQFGKYYFTPTTSYREGQVVFTAVSSLNCEGFNRFMYVFHGQWVIDNNLFPFDGVAPNTNLGKWNGCNKDVKSTFPISIKYLGGADFACDVTTTTSTAAATITARPTATATTTTTTTTNTTTTTTKTPMIFEVYDVDISNSCKYFQRFADGEGVVYYPTTKESKGEPFYQAYDMNTCLPYPRAVEHTYKDEKMIMSTEQGKRGFPVETVWAWKGCANIKDEQVFGFPRSTMSYFDSPFCPNVPNLQVDASNGCGYVVDEPQFGKYYFRPTTSYREGQVVFTAVSSQNCKGFNRFMYVFHGQWVIDNNLFPFDGVAPNTNLGKWTGCNKNMKSTSPISIKYLEGSDRACGVTTTSTAAAATTATIAASTTTAVK